MKATISKSEVMKQAWKSYKLFNGFNERTKQYGKILMSFATALKRAWAYVKELATKQPVRYATYDAGAAAYYSNYKYNGD